MIQQLALPRVMTAQAATQLSGSAVPSAEPTIAGATLAVDSESGVPLFAYLPMPESATFRRAVVEAPPSGSASFTTFGTSSDPVVPGRSAVMRYADRIVDLLNEITPGCAEYVDVFYGVINKSFVQPYHRDGDTHPPQVVPKLRSAPWAALVYLRAGAKGGYLRLPEYDVTIACDDGWGVLFPSAVLVHGITPMDLECPGAHRFSVLYGTLPGAKECFSGERTRVVSGWDTEFVGRMKGARG